MWEIVYFVNLLMTFRVFRWKNRGFTKRKLCKQSTNSAKTSKYYRIITTRLKTVKNFQSICPSEDFRRDDRKVRAGHASRQLVRRLPSSNTHTHRITPIKLTVLMTVIIIIYYIQSFLSCLHGDCVFCAWLKRGSDCGLVTINFYYYYIVL